MAWKHVIITGGSGFIGSHLVDALVPHAKTVTVVDTEKPLWKNEKAKYKHVDVRDPKVASVFEKAKPDVVFHLAAHIHDRESVREPVMNAEHNIIGSLNVFEAARQHLSGRFIFASTGIVYGNQEEFPIRETAVPRPLTPYAISKLTSERYLHFYHTVYGLSYAALRPGNVYGPRQDASAESGAIGIFGTQLMKGEQAFINNDGMTTRDYIYIDDVVAAFLAAARSDYVGVLNCGTGHETATHTIFETVREIVGAEASPEMREDVQDIVKRIGLDVTAAKAELDWEPRVPLKEGIERTINWYRENI